MKNKRNFESYMTFVIFFVCPFCIATVPTGMTTGKIEPVGTTIGPVQFDALIELNRYSPRSDRHDYTMLFARYWVARDYYAAAICLTNGGARDLL